MNALTEIIQEHAAYFIKTLPSELQPIPCELQVCVHSIPTKTNLVCGSALWTGKKLVACVAFENAFLLTQPAQKKKNYVYAVLRSTAKAGGLTYTYLLPPDDLLQVTVLTPEDADDVLDVDVSVKDYARNAMLMRR